MTYITGKRERIIELLCKRDEPMTLEAICAELLKDGHGRSTVYRLVSALTSEGVLRRESDRATRKVTYEYIKDECARHLHLRCLSCGSLVHLDAEASHSLEASILCHSGFALDEGAMLVGKCSECRSGEGKL